MGIGMALNLQKHLAAKGEQPLHFSNRMRSRGESLKSAGAIPEETFESVVEKSTIIVTMVSYADLSWSVVGLGTGTN